MKIVHQESNFDVLLKKNSNFPTCGRILHILRQWLLKTLCRPWCKPPDTIPNLLIMDQNKKKRAHCILVDRESLREAGNSFQHFSSSYNLTDEYYLCLSSNITILVPRKCSAIGETNLYGIVEYHSIGHFKIQKFKVALFHLHAYHNSIIKISSSFLS